MRFVIDQDVDARLVKVLVAAGHEAWTVSHAGMPDAKDDDISVYAAEKGAAVITHDREFSNRRRNNPHGRHVQLGCVEPEAPALVAEFVDRLVDLIEPHEDVFAHLSKEGVNIHLRWT